MKALKGFLFCHFNSRGGSCFVQGADAKEAGLKYWNSLFGQIDGEEVYDGVDDLMGPMILHIPDDFDPATFHGQDIDEGPGEVVVKTVTAGEDVTPFTLGTLVEAEFVPTGAQPQVLVPASRPRWDDDAFSFVFLA